MSGGRGLVRSRREEAFRTPQLWGPGDALTPPPWVFPKGDQGTCARNGHF